MGLYLSMGVSLLVLFRGRSPDPWARLLVVLLVVLVWGLLGPMYRYWGTRLAWRIHWMAPAAALLLMLIPLLLLRLGFAVTVLGFVCAASTLISLPTAAVQRLWPAWRRWRQPPDDPR